MQSQSTDFTPRAAIWQTGKNIRVFFDSDLFVPLRDNVSH